MSVSGVAMLNRVKLSEIGGERLLVCCDKCGLVSNRSVSALIGSYGDIQLEPLKAELSDPNAPALEKAAFRVAAVPVW